MSPARISHLTDEDITSSQVDLRNPHKTFHAHLPAKHPADLVTDINGYTANDLPYTHGDHAHFEPGVASANVAATSAMPHGTTEDNWNTKHRHQTVLQQHVSYWDKDNDGVIWPTDTFWGCRAWGWNIILCLIAVAIIHGGLAYPTSRSWIPDPFFRINLARVHRAKHGSDQMVYDNQGRFRSQAFEEIWANYDRNGKSGLDMWDLFTAWKGQRNAMDPFGWSAFAFEWLATYLLLWPEDGVIKKEDVRRVYDGSIFQKKADEYAAAQKAKSH